MIQLPKRNTPRWLIFLIDIGICLFSLLLAIVIRFDFFTIPYEHELPLIYKILPYFILVRAISFVIGSTYTGIIRFTSTQDALRIFLTITAGSICFVVLSPLRRSIDGLNFLPYGIILVDYLATIFLMISSRILIKLLYFEARKGRFDQTKVVIYGAGEAGMITKRTLDRDGLSSYKVIAFVDDDNSKASKSVEGKKIYHTSDLDNLLSKNEINQLIISIQNPDKEKKKNIIDLALKHNVQVLNVPPVSNWINGELSSNQLKKVRIEDLLGRKEIQLDKDKIASQIGGKIILVTGAAGSIGSGLVTQIIKHKPSKLILLDQAESPLYEVEMGLKNEGLLNNVEVVVADISQFERMENVFTYFKPQTVYHAAAYKHVPLMENNPTEAVNTNILGTKNLVDLSVKYNVEKFVMISTDKAVNPTNVMGASKRIAEIYAQSSNESSNTKFITTRFGNVLGSNGSVIPLFKKQIEKGGPITVTHKDITRFFMTIPEACQLVLEAGTMGNGGEIFVFDMGDSVKIVDLAKQMISLSGLELDKDIEIKYTGLRPGEKLYEELLNNEENTLQTHHPQILIGKVKTYPKEEILSKISGLTKLFVEQNNDAIVAEMKNIVPEYVSNNSVFSKFDK